MLLIISTMPCQELTFAGPHRGRQGLCGPRSIHFYAAPAIAHAVQCMRPDVSAQVMIENAGGMTEPHRAAMCLALGITPMSAGAGRC